MNIFKRDILFVAVPRLRTFAALGEYRRLMADMEKSASPSVYHDLFFEQMRDQLDALCLREMGIFLRELEDCLSMHGVNIRDIQRNEQQVGAAT